MGHPDLLLVRSTCKEQGLASAMQLGLTVLADLRMTDVTAQGHRSDLMAVAEAEHRQVELVDSGIDLGGILGINASRATGENERICTQLFDLSGRDVAGDDLRVNVEVAHATSDELAVLRTKVKNQNLRHELSFL